MDITSNNIIMLDSLGASKQKSQSTDHTLKERTTSNSSDVAIEQNISSRSTVNRSNQDISSRSSVNGSNQESSAFGDDGQIDETKLLPDKASVIIIYLASFMVIFTLSIIIPSVSLYSEQLNTGPAFAGLVVGVYALVGAFCAPLFVKMSDKSIMNVLLITIFVNILGNLIYALASLAKSPIMLLVSRAILGIGSTSIISHRVYIAYTVGTHYRSRYYQVLRISQLIGFSLGPAIGGVLIYVDFHIGDLVVNGSTAPAWALIIINLMFAVLVYTFFKNPVIPEHVNSDSRNLKQMFLSLFVNLRNTWLGTLFIGNFVGSTTMSMFDTAIQETSAQYFGYGASFQGYLIALMTVPSILSNLVSSKVSTSLNDDYQILFPAFGTVVFSIFLYQYSTPMEPAPYILGGILTLITINWYVGIVNSKVSKTVPVNDIGFTSLIQVVIACVARGVGPILGKALVAYWGPNAFAGLVTILSIIFASAFARSLIIIKGFF